MNPKGFGPTYGNHEPHQSWGYLKRGQIGRFFASLIPANRAAKEAARNECGPYASDREAVKVHLTHSESYTEALTLQMIPALPGQLTLQVHSRLSSAADPGQWMLQHQVIMQRADVFKLRDAIDRFLVVSLVIEGE